MSEPTANININLEGDVFVSIKNLQAEFKQLMQRVNVFEGDIKESFNTLNSSVSSFKTSFKQISFAALTDNVRNVADAFKSTTQPGVDFNQNMADLSAITGIVGKDLDDLGEYSRKLGVSSGLGASQASEAFKLLASNIDITTIGGIEGLKALQKETITLSQAAGVDMATAADTMSFAINQFKLSAGDASRVINVLGAGAKYGAAEIPDLASALKESGTTAKLAGLSIEDATGALEILSQRAVKGSEAGTGLRNVLLALQTKGIPGVDLKTQGLSASLSKMVPMLKDTTAMEKIFGRENINVASILISGAKDVEEMTRKVTGTTVAYDQAAIRTKTYQHELEMVKAKMDDFKIGITGMTGAMLPWSEYLIESLVPLSQMIPLFSAVGSGIKALTTAQWALNAAQYAMPILAVVGGLTALGAILYTTSNRYNAATAAAEDFADAQTQARKSIVDDKIETELLLKTARNLTLDYKTREDALDKLKKKSDEYFGQMTMDTVTTDAATVAFDKYAAAIEKVALAEALKEKIKERAKKELDLKENGPDRSFWQQFGDNSEYWGLGLLRMATRWDMSGFDYANKDIALRNKDRLSEQLGQNTALMSSEKAKLFGLMQPEPASTTPMVYSPQMMKAKEIMSSRNSNVNANASITINVQSLKESESQVKEMFTNWMLGSIKDTTQAPW